MSVNSNINMYYEELIDSIAERAKDNIADGGCEDESEAIWQAIDDGLMYCDQGYILAMAVCRDYISWYKEVNWDDVTEMIYEDVQDAMKALKEKQKNE